MARITIEDCMEKVPNRFHLVQMASIRAKQLKKGARPLLSSEDNKQVVMALREIAAGLVRPGELEADKPSATELFSEAPVAEAAVAEAAVAETSASNEASSETASSEETVAD